MDVGLVPELYSKLDMYVNFPTPDCTSPALKGNSSTDEVITPHQTVLLKLVDSYLQTTSSPSTPASPEFIRSEKKIQPMLKELFLALAAYGERAIRRSLGSITPVNGVANKEQQIPQELDVMLPKICEALVLVSQCMITICLSVDPTSPAGEAPRQTFDLRAYFNEKLADGPGVVEQLIGERLYRQGPGHL
jgi:ataxin-10